VNLGVVLEMAAEGAPDRVVVGARRGGLTTSDLLAHARRAAQAFTSAGVDRVAMLGLNSDAVPIALFGAAMAGVPFTPLNYRLPDDQLHAILGRVAPAIAVVDPDMADRLVDVDGLHLLTPRQLIDLDESAEAPPSGEAPFVDPESIAVLLFTSGTTGDPKAAVLRHRHLASYIIDTVEYLGADESEAQLVSVPSYHVAGISAVLSSVYAGRRIVYLPSFDPESWLATVNAESITQAMVVPTMLRRVLHLMEENGLALPSLRHLSYGGGRMPSELVERAMTLLPEVSFVNAYGLTETSSTISVLTPEDHRDAVASTDPAVRRRLGSVGRPLPTVELQIRGPSGDVLAPGAVGEIFVRGEQVAGEYLDRSVLTDDGWFPTSDAGSLDEAGFLYLDGRLDDVIVRGAENLSPGEIEDTLLAHPAVADAGVVGVPDAEWGEAVAAAVVLQDGHHATEAELQRWVRERLRSTKTPQVIQVRDDLPYTETGKLLRRVLRSELDPGSPARAAEGPTASGEGDDAGADGNNRPVRTVEP
jgi:acyl-CoA synthetase (AMP-forming)/AMP-acid ligase II